MPKAIDWHAFNFGGTPAFSDTFYFEMDGLREFFTQIATEVEIVWPGFRQARRVLYVGLGKALKPRLPLIR